MLKTGDDYLHNISVDRKSVNAYVNSSVCSRFGFTCPIAYPSIVWLFFTQHFYAFKNYWVQTAHTLKRQK